MGVQRMPVDPDTGIPDLISRLSDDAKRLASDEVRLAKLEAQDNIHRAGLGTMWLGAAFGAGFVMLVGLTVFVATFIGRFVRGHMWLGAIIVGVVELALAAWFVILGIRAIKEPSYSLEKTRESVAETANWVRTVH